MPTIPLGHHSHKICISLYKLARQMAERIFLIGFMGIGKSTLGRGLARALEMPFIDVDEVIEEQAGMPIRDIFDLCGEAYFRRLEHDALHEIIQDFPTVVVASGGGLPCQGDNMEVMNAQGLTVYLQADAKALTKRLYASRATRPMIAAIASDNLQAHIENLLSARRSYYELARLTLPIPLTGSKQSNISLLVSAVENALKGRHGMTGEEL